MLESLSLSLSLSACACACARACESACACVYVHVKLGSSRKVNVLLVRAHKGPSQYSDESFFFFLVDG